MAKEKTLDDLFHDTLKDIYYAERKILKVNRPGFAGGSNFQIGWSHDEQNDEQVFP